MAVSPNHHAEREREGEGGRERDGGGRERASAGRGLPPLSLLSQVVWAALPLIRADPFCAGDSLSSPPPRPKSISFGHGATHLRRNLASAWRGAGAGPCRQARQARSGTVTASSPQGTQAQDPVQARPRALPAGHRTCQCGRLRFGANSAVANSNSQFCELAANSANSAVGLLARRANSSRFLPQGCMG